MRLAVTIALAILVPCVVSAQVLPQIAPSGTVNDPIIRVANTSGNQVTFTVTNLNGGTDGQVSRTCARTGNVTSVTCSSLTFMGEGQVATVTATFTTGAAGTGTITLTVDPTNPDGPPVSGSWQETIVSASGTVTPDNLALTTLPNLNGQSQVFTVTNPTRAKTTYTLTSACPNPGVPSCSVPSPATLIVDSAGSGANTGTATVTYSTGGPGTQGSLTVTATAAGVTMDQGSINVSTVSASVTTPQTTLTPVTGTSVPVGFTVTNNGVVTTSYGLVVGCAGAGVTNCSGPSPAALNNIPAAPGAGSSNPVSMSFVAGPNGTTGTVTLQVTFAATVIASITVNVMVSANPPVVSVTPDGGAALLRPPSAASTQTFVVTHAGLVPSTYNLTAVCTTPDATACPTLSPILFNTAGSQNVVVNFTSGATGSTTGKLQLTATRNAAPAVTDNGFVDVRVITATAVPALASTVVPASSAGQTASFTITNTGPVAATLDLAAVCSGTAVSIPSCSLSATQLPNLAPGTPTAVTLTFTSGPSGTGSVGVSVRLSGTSIATGSTAVTIGVLQAPTVITSTVNPDSVWLRSQCLTMVIGPASAAECGDLRIYHALPSVRTMSTLRTPALVYNSAHAIGWAMLAANVTLPAGATPPSSVTATLVIGGNTRATGTWPGSQWTSGATRRIALGFSAQSAPVLATGFYDYQLTVTNVYGGSSLPATITGRLAVVNRSQTAFGAGWWLAGLEQFNPATGVWVGGDGSMRQYRLRPGSAAPTRVWGAPSMTYPDSVREVGADLIRQLPDSVWVYFNASGQHTKTRNRQGHITQFGYTTGLLTTITLPPAASPLSYTFAYTSNRLSTVIAPGDPASRTTTVTIAAATNRLTQILEPDTRTVAFGYGSDGRITSRTDRRLTVTGFKYDAANHVERDSIAMGGTKFIKRVMVHASSAGWSGAAVDTAQVFTRLDGPRFGVSANTTTFYVNRFQAPIRIVNALSQVTRLGRGVAGYPGLVDTLVTTTGLQVVATYDPRGRILTSSEPSTTGATATTSFQWDPTWDQVTRITNPETDFTEFSVDPATGNRLWQQDARGISSRTTFAYNTSNQVRAIALPNNADQLIDYDTKGNLRQVTTPLGYTTTYTNNGIGLATQIQSPTGATPPGSPFATETIVYTKRNEDSIRTTVSSGQTQIITKTFDEEGNVLSAKREFTPLAGGIQTNGLTTVWVYDRANRDTSQTEPDGTRERRVVDDAGNVTAVTTRRGKVISMGYDALNRLTDRTVTGETISYAASQIAPSSGLNAIPYSFTIPSETQSFTYYPDGQVATANNQDATVTRNYFTNGKLQSEVLGIKSTDRASVHTYTTSYTYDKNGRRTTVTAPATFAGSAITHVYDPTSGLPASMTDIAGNFFSFAYNGRNELTGIFYPGNMSRRFGYDADGRVVVDTVQNGNSLTFPNYPTQFIRRFQVGSRDARGLIRSSSDPDRTDQVSASYDGLGHLQTTALKQNLINLLNMSPVQFATTDTMTTDAMGNISQWIRRDSMGGNPTTVTRTTGTDIYSSVGRLTNHGDPDGLVTYTYDGAGNQTFQNTITGAEVIAERASFYAQDERLRATDTRAPARRTFEEYRYDALGRRVWVKSGTQCLGVGQIDCITRNVQRVIWDGNQELAEIRVPVDTTNAAVEEMDVNYPTPDYSINVSLYGDPSPWYGHVVYSPGVEVDQPLSVSRYYYVDQPGGAGTPKYAWTLPAPAPTGLSASVSVFWNYQGVAAYGALTTGAVFKPKVLAGGQTICPALGTTTDNRCMLLQWPSLRSAYDENRGGMRYLAWQGSLLVGKRDGSGLLYKRDRMYDPTTGRFTQEDPAGLAGGLNGYGFAGSDPINFSDPFGLCPSRAGSDPNRIDDCPADERFIHLMARNLGPWEGPLLAASTFVLFVAAAPAEASAGLTLVTLSATGRAFESMAAPVAITNSTLLKLLDRMFRLGDRLPGGTIGAVRAEAMTGLRMAGKFHAKKLFDLIQELRKLAKSQVLTPEEQELVSALYKNALDALRSYLQRRFHPLR